MGTPEPPDTGAYGSSAHTRVVEDGAAPPSPKPSDGKAFSRLSPEGENSKVSEASPSYIFRSSTPSAKQNGTQSQSLKSPKGGGTAGSVRYASVRFPRALANLFSSKHSAAAAQQGSGHASGVGMRASLFKSFAGAEYVDVETGDRIVVSTRQFSLVVRTWGPP